ncbi:MULTISPECIES: protein-glutamate methylesterase/protein-glutamine glutaminase [unclassified Salinivibrio]|uniref:protein-glutamate methylesterase/protein-glutamine glutaminase n=1 Tax=unclassified Salinivibrio TaxID=2636825 RepID=UPI00084BCEF0|nr:MULTISPECIES: chemotaxis response regulator protein-glutamate methylesterase [unclassified Salinivibrio]ODQ01106.1 chemotaxis response regulator protein-glutamate methylesterase [Salinivibrio sp. DV]OOF23963.1 chemotaxis response regulator protein-glutamate methylesterase [Salinivibrio sp. IB574]PCE67848.1 chemotaxis response regulator protein-glutamate methylesterase [Salinivibrio sp. YCSC6]QCF35257.1 chemotaxis response regulator protein-glutamate methylesterase [Salinivibrio sp. YCSC6]
MAVKVLVVDDSSFFRRRVSEIINGDPRLEVIDTAVNGKEAVEKVAQLKPDVVTMDIEMPVLDGISAVRQIMAQTPTPILMFSSLTHEGAKATLDALEAGALDFLPKKFEDIARNRDEATSLLQQRVLEIARKRSFLRRPSKPAPSATTGQTASPAGGARAPVRPAAPNAAPAAKSKAPARFTASGKRYQLVAIGTSTGGPVALQKVLTKLPANFPLPIVLIQHMPATFTAAFAQRLNGLSQITVTEAKDGDALKPGHAYLAPGGMQMMIDGRPGAARLKILDGGERMNYKPCVDVTFGSAAKVYGDKVLSMVLTGMGADGREGARMLKSAGSTIWAQDEESCVVYGMPQAVAKAGISSEDLPLDRIAERILVELNLK